MTNLIQMRTEAAPPEKTILRLSFEGATQETVEKFHQAALKKAAPFKSQYKAVLVDDNVLGQLLLAGDLYLCVEGDTLHCIIYVAPRGNKAVFELHILSDADARVHAEYLNKLTNSLLENLDGIAASIAVPINDRLVDVFKIAGFDVVGRLRRDQLIEGELQDTLFLEVMNPALAQPSPVLRAVPSAVQPVVDAEDEDAKYEEIDKQGEMEIVSEPTADIKRPRPWKMGQLPKINGITETVSFE